MTLQSFLHSFMRTVWPAMIAAGIWLSVVSAAMLLTPSCEVRWNHSTGSVMDH